MKLTRRQMLGAGLAGAAGVGGSVLFWNNLGIDLYLKYLDQRIKSPSFTKKVSSVMQPDFNVMKKVSASQASQLESILEDGNEFCPGLQKVTTIKTDYSPVFIYNFPVEKDKEGLFFKDFGGGAGIIFHEQGFLMTAAHVIDVTRLKSTYAVLVVYDPFNGSVGTIDILAVSKKYDVALCKVDTNPGIYPNIPIVKHEPIRPAVVYSRVLGDIDFLGKSKSQVIDMIPHDGGPCAFDPALKHTEKEMMISLVAGKVDDGQPFFDAPLGVRFFNHNYLSYDEKKADHAIQGNSGSPVFTPNNQLCGVISSAYTNHGQEINAESILGMGFAGPTVTRALIRFYIDQCVSGR